MGVFLSAARVEREIARQGWTHADLARAAGVSQPTVTAALGGRSVAPRTLRLIAQALLAQPPIDGIDSLLL
jgi:lambda repressor-like predicted transcriptional regulator